MSMFKDLGPYGDLVDFSRKSGPLFPSEPVTVEAVREVLRFTGDREEPLTIESGRRWQDGGLAGEEVSWSVGFGPRTDALFLKPAGTSAPLPGIVALYDHGHFKFHGKEKIADGADGPLAAVQPFRDTYYSGRAYANELARQGFGVLVHDTFLWGSRKFPLEAMPEGDLALAETVGATLNHGSIDQEIMRYHGA